MVFNSICVFNLPENSKLVDLTILASKTHILPFLSCYWLDTRNNTGHLMLKKTSFLGFVLFVLRKYFCRPEEIQCYFKEEFVDRTIVETKDFIEFRNLQINEDFGFPRIYIGGSLFI